MTSEQARWLLDHLVAAAVRYGHDLAILLIAVPPGGAVAATQRRLATALRDADVISPWGERRFIALLPDTDRAGADRAADRIRAAAGDLPVAVGQAHWAGDTTEDLLARAERSLAHALGSD